MNIKQFAFTLSAASIWVAAFLGIQPVSAQSFDEVFVVTERITLEEPDDVYTVFPHVSAGEFKEDELVITDAEESQVRIYDRRGAFEALVGTRGRGPGEFQDPQVAVRVPSGRLVVGTLGGDLSVFDASNAFVETHSDVLDAITGATVIPSTGRLLLVGSEKRERGSHPLLHLFDVSSGTVLRSFFPHPTALGTYGHILMSIADLAAADAREDQIVAVFGPETALHLFKDDGTFVRRVPFSLDAFRGLDAPRRDEPLASGTVFEAQTSYSRFTRVVWAAPDVVLLQYFDLLDVRSWTVRHSLAAVRLDGTVLFELTDTPRLFGHDAQTGHLFFQDPEWETPERIVVARLRTDSEVP